jgi:filamentous hemagglutinin family protein
MPIPSIVISSRRDNSWSPFSLLCVLVMGGLFSTAHAATTNITADGTLGTTVTPSGNVYDIGGGTIKGTNQFHSFSQFSIGAGDVANFTGPAGIQNIIGRVTGGTVSDIDGTISSGIAGANLFLLNPAGIMFGPNASLSIDGSFHATTADYISLADGARFNAVPSAADALLTASAPAAFGFLNSAPAPIEVVTPGLLHVPVGATLSFVGGEVDVGATDGSIPAYLLAPAGRVNLVSVASPGEATFDGIGFNVDGFAQLGDVNIRGGSIVDGKEVFIRGGRLLIDESVLMPGAFAFLGVPVPPPDGGQVNIKVTGGMTITGTALEPNTQAPPGILVYNGTGDPNADPTTLAPAKVPDVNIDAGSLSVSGNASIQTDRLGPGDAGNIVINAPVVQVSNGSAIALYNFYAGSGGSLTINAQQVDLTGTPGSAPTGLAAQATFHPSYFHSSIDPALTYADSGSITVNASDYLRLSGGAAISTESTAFGRGGDITINAGDVLLQGTGQAEGGAISAQTLLAGDAGNISINASGQIQIEDGFRITANTGGSGNGGNVALTAGDSITLTGANSRILSGTVQPPDDALNALFLSVYGISFDDLRTTVMGDPTATLMDVLAFLNSAGFTAVSDLTPGDAGTISITTPVLTMNADTRIEASTGWGQVIGPGPDLILGTPDDEVAGNAGAIIANVNSLYLNDGASIRDRSGIELLNGGFAIGRGNAGTVNVAATDTISISGHSPTTGAGSTITTSTLGDGNGGDIVLTANQVDVLDGGSISSDSLGGAGLTGAITINAGDQIVMNNGSISTRAVTSDGGDIELTAPNIIQLTDSQISTSVESGLGKGGNITLDPEFITLNSSSITANAYGGPGGNILIVAQNYIPSIDSTVEASSAQNVQGTVQINSPDNDIAGSISQLPQNYVDPSALLPAPCVARHSGAQSSFVVGGSGGVAVDPDNYLPSFSSGDALPGGAGNAAGVKADAGFRQDGGIALARASWECSP